MDVFQEYPGSPDEFQPTPAANEPPEPRPSRPLRTDEEEETRWQASNFQYYPCRWLVSPSTWLLLLLLSLLSPLSSLLVRALTREKDSDSAELSRQRLECLAVMVIAVHVNLSCSQPTDELLDNVASSGHVHKNRRASTIPTTTTRRRISVIRREVQPSFCDRFCCGRSGGNSSYFHGNLHSWRDEDTSCAQEPLLDEQQDASYG